MTAQNPKQSNLFKSIDPISNEVIAEYREMSPQDVDDIIESAHSAYSSWRATEFSSRSKLMKQAAKVLLERKLELAALMTAEMGKLRTEGLSEIEKCAWVCDYYADHAERFLADERIEADSGQSFVSYRPIGVVLAVMPWNFPFWQVFRFAAPTLMAGNAAVLKHARNVCGCALAIESVFKQAGFPDDLFRTLLIGKEKVAQVIKHSRVRAVTLTGSTEAGRAVARLAADSLKKTVLELGGSDPYLILEDADIDDAARKCARSRLINGGQSCIAAKRFVVVNRVYDAFLTAFLKEFEAIRVGDPNDESGELAPLASQSLRDNLHRQVRSSIAMGAKCLLGGVIPDRVGAWYPPSVLTDVSAGMPAYDEELFGPVASVIRAADEDDAIKIANASDFGLGGAVFTKDRKKGLDIARNKIDSGAVAVNGFVESDPRLPFGGIKDSGYGRELSRYGILEFVNIKTVTAENCA